MRLSPLFFIFLSKLTKSQCPPSDLPNPNSPNKQCDCDDGNIKTEVISGAIWPAWGTLNDQGIILPPANCSGTSCWRANVTCSVRVSGNVSKQPTWTWNWIPTVQYPLGDKNFYSLHKQFLTYFWCPLRHMVIAVDTNLAKDTECELIIITHHS